MGKVLVALVVASLFVMAVGCAPTARAFTATVKAARPFVDDAVRAGVAAGVTLKSARRTAAELAESTRPAVELLLNQAKGRNLKTNIDAALCAYKETHPDHLEEFMSLSRSLQDEWIAYLPSVTPEQVLEDPDVLSVVAAFVDCRIPG